MTRPLPPGAQHVRKPLPDARQEKFAQLVADGAPVARAYAAAGFTGERNGSHVAQRPLVAARIAHLARVKAAHRKPAGASPSPPSAPVDDTSPSAPVATAPPATPAGAIDLEAELTALYRAATAPGVKVRILGQISALRRFGDDPQERTGKRPQPAQRAPSPSHAAPKRDTLADDLALLGLGDGSDTTGWPNERALSGLLEDTETAWARYVAEHPDEFATDAASKPDTSKPATARPVSGRHFIE